MAGRITRDELAQVTVAQQRQRQYKPGTKQEYRMVNPDTDAEYARFTATSAERADAQARLYAAEHDIAYYNYIVLDPAMQVVGGDLRHTATPGRHSDPNGRYEIVSRASGESAEPRFTFSVQPQQVPYVLQAWSDRNGTTPDQWMVTDIDSGEEIPSARPGYASTAGIDPLWRVYLRTNMARSVEVRAPDEESALAAAKQADPDSFPNFVTINDVAISRQTTRYENNNQYQIINQNNQEVATAFLAPNDEAALIRLDQYQRSHPDEPYVVQTANGIQIVGLDIEQNLPDRTWEIYRISDPYRVYHTITAPSFAAALTQARTLLSRNGQDPGEFNVLPAAVSGSTQDLQQQRATPGSFTGAWRVLDTQGREVYRFSGVGNVQADANRVAIDWLQNNGYDPAEYSVLPIVS
jgi:hypothetical protein